jgi:Gamma-glutamyl phosphate reductase
MVEGLEEALAHIAAHRPCLTAAIATNRYESAMRFTERSRCRRSVGECIDQAP